MKIAIVRGNLRDTEWGYKWQAEEYHFFDVPTHEYQLLSQNLHLLNDDDKEYKIIEYVEPEVQYTDVLDKLRKKMAAVEARRKAEEAKQKKRRQQDAAKILERKRKQLEKLKKELESNADV